MFVSGCIIFYGEDGVQKDNDNIHFHTLYFISYDIYVYTT